MPTKLLPASPDVNHLKYQAKDLLSDFRRGKMSAFQRIREFHPKFSTRDDTSISKATFSLSDAQLSIAREYGYTSWARLKVVIAEALNQEASLTHNDRINNGLFKQALDFLDEGNATLLTNHLAKHPRLVHQQVFFEGDNYFTNPTLIEFIAENPTRQEQLPDNIVEIAQIILDAGAKDNQKSLDSTLMLVASGRIVRECGAEEPLLNLLCDYGADPSAGIYSALAHGEFDATQLLVARGAPLNLSTAAALGHIGEVSRLIDSADEDQLQLGLSLSALHNRTSVVTALLKAGADPNRYNPLGGHSHCTPLHSAIWEGHLDTVKTLVNGGSLLDIGDIHHNAPALAWAEHAGHDDIVSYLKSKL